MTASGQGVNRQEPPSSITEPAGSRPFHEGSLPMTHPPAMPTLCREANWIWPPDEQAYRLQRLRRRRIYRALRSQWSLAVLAVPALLFYAGLLSAGVAIWLTLVCAALPVFLFNRAYQSALGEDRDLIGDFGPLPAGACFVSLKVVQGSACTGSDLGILWLERDGRLMFSGQACSFGLARRDVYRAGPERKGGPDRLILNCASPAGDVGLLIRSLLATKGKPKPSEMLGEFLEANRSAVLGQVPPMRIGPGADSARLIKRQLAGLLLAAVIMVAFLVYSPQRYVGGTFQMAFYGISAMANRLRAWNSLRKIEEASRPTRGS